MRTTALLVAGVLFAGCSIDSGSFAGKGCDTNNDCPDPYSCALVRPSGRTCELVRGIELGGGGPTVAPDYCVDVKPLLDATCLVNCHGPQMDHPGSPNNFRLDYYEPDGGGLPGAKAKALNIKNRVTFDDMPPDPASTYPHLTGDQRAVVIAWVNSGATYCNDAGARTGDAGRPDAGGSNDAGKSDGGKPDGG